MNDELLKQMLSVLPDEELKTINKFIWEILKERNQAARSLMEVVGKMVEMWRNGTRYDLNHLDRLSEVWPKDKCVHTEHCCKNCGCKYGEYDCPVVSGAKEQSFPCGDTYPCGKW